MSRARSRMPPRCPSRGFERDPLSVMAKGHRRHGPVLQMLVDGYETVVVGSPQGLRELFAAERGRVEVLNTPLVHDLFGQALFNLTGALHVEARRRLRPPLSSRALAGYAEALMAVTESAAAVWAANPREDLYTSAREVTLAMSAQVLLGIGPEEPDAQVLADAFGDLVAATGVSPGGRRYLVQRYWAGMLARRRLGLLFGRRADSARGRGPGCALEELMHGFVGAPASVGPLADHLLALLIAARETTASLITWCLVELAGDPHHARLAVAEARAALGRPDLLVRADALPVLRAVMAEVQRLHSPNLLSIRRAIAPLSLCGYDIPVGARVAYCTSAGHFDAEDFPQPEAFQPNRFLSGQASSARLWAFGGGSHACLGRPLAELMTMSVLASVLNRGLPRLLDAGPSEVRYRPAKAPIAPVPFALNT